MGYSQGLSGLSAASNELDTIGNNIANSSTTGFKSGTTVFADMYANTVSTAVSTPSGIGVNTVGVEQDYGQGTFDNTGVPLDVAINGNGFFRMSVNGEIEYSRDGEFHTDANGYLIDAEGANVTGYTVGTDGIVSSTNPVPIQIPMGNMAPSATTTVTATGLNLDSSAAIPTTTPFNPTDDTSYSFSDQITTYDTLGDSHTMQLYYVRNSPSSPITYDVYAAEDGTLVQSQSGTAGTTGLIGTMDFSSTGTLTGFVSAGGTGTQTNTNEVLVTGIDPGTGATTPMSINFDFSGATAYGGTGNTANLQPDGNAAGNYVSASIDENGDVVCTYSNGLTETVAQLVLASFNNNNGLQPVGGNKWIQTGESGEPTLGVAGSGTFSSLQTESLENSNVDLTGELVDLITAQRFYQANAQTIKTQDTVDQTLLQMN
ncbi:flagellar hook protein FlgE [Pararobbsia silviterrae]|uniref:Flagellar hook protein FlgE n=1 Tax=Pararobbsia silviterrae TaxID=1792498 RepID=A0A494X4U0_9BURK|nr:flagellar hook protein FlgE [Pararobbsia silviterrae]RKP45362.1 flagellar hook protein FlgE [Pararobbsia silviterrae]